nr:MAG: replication initiator protein [Microvirus sp.]
MSCFNPLEGYRSKDRNPSGKRSLVFTKPLGYTDLPIKVPCGQCTGCRELRSKEWAVRCVHEASMYEDNCFATLTYAPEKLPKNETLRVRDFQLFINRLRKNINTCEDSPIFSPGRKIRYFHAGEYGEQTCRPHYHALLFNLDFSDKTHTKTVNDQKYYESKTLETIWQNGSCILGAVTFESAAYVARYIFKKMNGPLADLHYNLIDQETGEILAEKKPEYTTMSRRPGIGQPWFEKFRNDVFPCDNIVLQGKKYPVPKFYTELLKREQNQTYAKIKAKRQLTAIKQKEDQTWERLKVREEVHLDKIQKLKRGLKK